ncbi:hypothetical protein JJV70_07045 [Streptomyces sp. JJ66]|uniref:hypothetical protein n=1 Tax=Streptomyces sp. JJ66 TaxID=2803843 RepID=UPI001C57314D|nr:hypothetical protein [Streptomyces sp. JJ66]MBW1601869.1 hypothetical protein [Streptomyces sp. JJ66]
MPEEVARKLARVLRLTGLPGEAAPLDPAHPSGLWGITADDRDITLDALDALINALEAEPEPEPPQGPGWHDGRPVRGFIFPEPGHD